MTMVEFSLPKNVQPARIQMLNEKGMGRGKYVLYWMQQSQRAEDNHALETAIEVANQVDLPLLVVFGLTDAYPEANLRHYTFMLEGLRETGKTLHDRGIKFVVKKGAPPNVALRAGSHAVTIVCDRGYLRHQKAWRKKVAEEVNCQVFQVESDVVVPVEAISPKAEYAARTIRPKIHRLLEDYLLPLRPSKVKHSSLNLNMRGLDIENCDKVLKRLDIDGNVLPVSRFFRGGTSQAKNRFRAFLAKKLKRYDEHSNQPQTDDISGMSPYLHFGQISPLSLALEVKKSNRRKVGVKNIESFLEELIVRRELAMNFAHYTPDYDAYTCIPGWAAKTLNDHAGDTRDHLYSRDELAEAQTHDPYWNAAMLEMVHTGFMHNYMRMYWGKKILEWSRTPEEAFQTTIELNNRYFLDGRDPNSYAGVAWIYGVHDRAWAERPIFGKVRYMAASGLERKCDIKGYVQKVENCIHGS
jgi:deoxyribodipyrimidine photo-lyase